MEANVQERLKLQESRPGLLIRRLLKGRAGWKRKCGEAKETIQAQRVRIRDLETSRNHWRELAEQVTREKRELEAEVAQLRGAAAELDSRVKKKVKAEQSSSQRVNDACRGINFRYPKYSL